MDGITGTLTVLVMFGLRLIAPLFLIAVVAFLFRRIDLKWQNEAWSKQQAELYQETDGGGEQWLERLSRPCWEEMGCEESSLAKCPAHVLASLPCWMARRWAEGTLPAKCYQCERFTLRPAPLPTH